MTRAVQLLVATILISGLAAAPAAQTRSQHKRPSHRTQTTKPLKNVRAPLECGDYVGFQVLLDREGFSPGEIDGYPGDNLSRALTAFQAARGLAVSGAATCETWRSLGGDQAGELIAAYTVSDEDVNGPFVEAIPNDLMRQATLPALGYRSPIERLAEKFHCSPRLLSRLNPHLQISAGTILRVPAVPPFDAGARPSPNADSDVTIVVSKDDSSLRALGGDGRIVFFAPVTTGSIHDPLPVGDWKVTGVRWMPPFHYNPQLFWDAKPNDSRATIKPGPNGPVGVVWIDLDRPHYGLHGTPDPSAIGRTASHGCVRMTNWDAARVTALVKPGTPVQFR
jgi:lipoprotein-anchoring transpeptidase ErfK/SrfK